MKIAILSDIHDNIWNLKKVLLQLEKENVETAILCGDYCAPSTFKMATEQFRSAHCVWGNVDGEKFRITREIFKNKIKRVILYGEYGETELDNRKIFFNHFPGIAENAAKSDVLDAAFHGHTHTAKNEKLGKTILVNPGAVCGIINGKPAKASYAIYNTKTNSAEIIEIK